jgi:hypothetical protein
MTYRELDHPPPRVLPDVIAPSGDAPALSIPIAARPRAVVHSANDPWSSSRRQAGSTLPAGTSSTNPSFRSLPIAFLARLPFGFPVRAKRPRDAAPTVRLTPGVRDRTGHRSQTDQSAANAARLRPVSVPGSTAAPRHVHQRHCAGRNSKAVISPVDAVPLGL